MVQIFQISMVQESSFKKVPYYDLVIQTITVTVVFTKNFHVLLGNLVQHKLYMLLIFNLYKLLIISKENGFKFCMKMSPILDFYLRLYSW